MPILPDELSDFCKRWQICEVALFGSALREDFNENSDVDVMVTFTPTSDWSLLDHLKMEQELASLLGRKVDLISKRAIERSPNWILRREILRTAEVIHVSR